MINFLFSPHRRWEAWRFFSYGLVHVGYLHLLSNCLVNSKKSAMFLFFTPGAADAWGAFRTLLWQRKGSENFN